METEFIPYEQALKLKDLGFDEKCLGYYIKDEFQIRKKFDINNSHVFYIEENKKYENYLVCVPLWQQAFDWFRNNNKIDGYVYQETKNSFVCVIHYLMQEDSKSEYDNHFYVEYRFSSYSEAREYCLKFIIEKLKKIKP